MLVDADEHEPLGDDRWNAVLARKFVTRIVGEIDAAYDGSGSWPVHPEDAHADEMPRLHGVYSGGAGTMWGLVRLAERYGLTLAYDYRREIVTCEARYRAHPLETDTVVPSYFLGSVGIACARFALTRDRARVPEMIADARTNVGNPTREALWGSAGTAFAALLVREHDATLATAACDALLRATHDELWETWIPQLDRGGLLWEQVLYGGRSRYVGAAHGAFGNLVPFVRARDLLSTQRRAQLRDRVAALLHAYAIVDDGDSNFWSLGEPPEGKRMQWCHGSPGIVTSLAAYPTDDERVERALVAAGEGIWRSGPLRKGPTLCHGTAGNGFALLRLARRTSDRRWFARAERFAMHAIRQVATWRESFGMPSASLWTGDLGVAVYVDAVLRRDPAILTLDAM